MRLLTQEVEPFEHRPSRGVGIQFDIVLHGGGGEEAIDAARRDQVVRNDLVEQRVGILKKLTRLDALRLVVQNARVDALQAPGVEERGPVDESAQGGEREIVQHADAGELGRRDVPGAPLDRRAACAGGIERNHALARRGVGTAQRFVIGAMLFHEGGFAIVAQQAGGDRNRAAGVEHMHHGLAVMRGDLDGGMRAAGSRAADQQG